MSLEIKGKLTHKLEPVTGEGSNGQWKKQEFVIETMDQYPKSVCFVVWGDKIDFIDSARNGDVLSVFFDVESREYNGKWYTNLKAWKVEAEARQETEAGVVTPVETGSVDGKDLPF